MPQKQTCAHKLKDTITANKHFKIKVGFSRLVRRLLQNRPGLFLQRLAHNGAVAGIKCDGRHWNHIGRSITATPA